MNTLYTIGHSNLPLESFIRYLHTYHIGVLVDVRSTPYSQRHPQYRKHALDSALYRAGIIYRFMGQQLGARRTEPECYVNGRVSYERIAALPSFHDALQTVLLLLIHDRVALMCAEHDPIQCHRAILICRQMAPHCQDIVHITHNGSAESHRDAEARLVRQFGGQPELFAQPGESEQQRAYRLQAEHLAVPEPDTNAERHG